MSTKKRLQSCFELVKVKVIYSVYPFLKARSLVDYLSSDFIFNKYETPTSFIEFLIIIFIICTIFISGSRLPFLNDYKPYRSKQFGSLGLNIITAQCFTAVEVVILRVWIYLLIWKHRSPEHIDFVKLLRKLTPKDDKRILFILKCILTEITLSATVFNVTIMMIDGINSTNYMQKVISLIHCIEYFIYARIAIRDLMIIYALAIAGFKIVSRKVDSFNCMMKDMDYTIENIIDSYFDLILSVGQLNKLAKMLMFTGTFLVVPTAGFLIMIILIPTDGILMIYMKYVLILTVVFFTIRGYFLLFILSSIDSKSRKIYFDINSNIARSRCDNLSKIVYMKLILEDICCKQSLVQLREFNSPITRLDFLNNIISTISFVTLLFSLKNSMKTY